MQPRHGSGFRPELFKFKPFGFQNAAKMAALFSLVFVPVELEVVKIDKILVGNPFLKVAFLSRVQRKHPPYSCVFIPADHIKQVSQN